MIPITIPAMAPPDMPEDGAGVEDEEGDEAGRAELDAEGVIDVAESVGESVGMDSNMDEVMGVGSEDVGAEDAGSDFDAALVDTTVVLGRVLGESVVAGALLFAAFVVGAGWDAVVRSGFCGPGAGAGALGAGGGSKNDAMAPPTLWKNPPNCLRSRYSSRCAMAGAAVAWLPEHLEMNETTVRASRRSGGSYATCH